MFGALRDGQRQKAFQHAKAALRQFTIFGRSLRKANTIAGLS
jgi:hypothetical protein